MSYVNETTYLIIGLVLLALYVLILALAIAEYVTVSLALYTMAKNRGIKHPGLAWVPVANVWIIGKLVNEYDRKNGIEKKWHHTLLTLTLLMVGLMLLAYAAMFAAGALYAFLSYDNILALTMPFYLLMIPAMLLTVAFSACLSICYYKLFEEAVPEKAVKYLLLSLMVPLADGICLLKIRNFNKPQEQEPVEIIEE